MVRNVTERLIGNPAVVAIVHGPAAGRERLPAWINTGRAPHLVLCAIITDTLPAAVFFQRIGFVANRRGQVACRRSAEFCAFIPHAVTLGIPVIPRRVDRAIAESYFIPIGNNRGRTFSYLVFSIGCVMDKIYVATNRDDFQRLIADIEVKDCLSWRYHIPEGCGDFDGGVIALVVQAR